MGPGARASDHRLRRVRARHVGAVERRELGGSRDRPGGGAEKPIAPLLLSGRPFFRLRHLQYEDVRDRSMPSEEFVTALRAMVDKGQQVSFRGRVSLPHSPRPPSEVLPVSNPASSVEGSPRTGRRVVQHRWMAPAWGVAMFLLFFVGTLLTISTFTGGGDGGSGPAGVAVGTCVSKGEGGTLAALDCAGEGAQVITQIAAAGHFCTNPRDGGVKCRWNRGCADKILDCLAAYRK
jgi:hypothetical protein